MWKRLHEFGIKPRKPWSLFANVPSKNELKKLYQMDKLSTWEIEKRFGYHRSTVHNKLKEFGIATRDIAESHVIYPRKPFSGDLTEKAYMLGFAWGDLKVKKFYKNSKTISAECASTKNEQIDLMKRLFGRYGHVWVSRPNKTGAISVGVGLDMSFEFLLEKKVHEWILDSKECFFSFLAGFTDAEGHMGVHNNMAVYSLGNYDIRLLRMIHRKLLDFGIENRKPINHHTKGYVGKDGYVHNQDYWSLVISRKDQLLKLFDAIEPHLKHEKRLNDLKKAKLNILQRNDMYGAGK